MARGGSAINQNAGVWVRGGVQFHFYHARPQRSWNLRHMKFQDRIVRAPQPSAHCEPGSLTLTLPLRRHCRSTPDGSLLIIDVTVPFEDRVEALG
ncbi:hypothetical protein JTE90_021016 [Oedothorax gibbosus]|uniref:Uncharacterized protein n=1 Tax=Oedothorax gibbosus TaxID=931172 RepID=A0AAV6TEZ2_9ARAC|nr:hypothetical protein JTE90_021016 [Oedothorax gibbosus]